MSSSVGRIALGVVGAVILAPAGLSALGFSIGSAIGGLIFAPDGPQTEGPRIGDTSVTSSTLGKVIPEHYAVTRTAGNVIWSGGIKESKEVETAGKGGEPASNTTYSYSASFAVALGKAPAQRVLRIWADGKLIYDITGGSATVNDKYKVRFHLSGHTTPDLLIKESLNRRLYGLPDVNEGSGQQASFKTIDTLIADYSSASSNRAAMYATYLAAVKASAEMGSPTIPDYGFTPTYSEYAYIVFDDMKLVDFGNRIPNITVEAAWGDTSITVGNIDEVAETEVTETSADTTEPTSGVGVSVTTRRMAVISGTKIRKFSLNSLSETLNTSTTSGMWTMDDILCTTEDNILVKATALGVQYLKLVSMDTLTFLSLGTTDYIADPTTVSTQYAASCNTGDTAAVVAVGAGGEVYAVDTHTASLDAQGGTYSTAGVGPICEGGKNIVFMLAQDGLNWNLYLIRVEDSFTSSDAISTKLIASGLGETVSNLFYEDNSSTLWCIWDDGAGGAIIREYDVSDSDLRGYVIPEGSVHSISPTYTQAIPLTPPSTKSGMQRSAVYDGHVMYASGNDLAYVSLDDGSSSVTYGVIMGTGTSAASSLTNVYVSPSAGFVGWSDGKPKLIANGAANFDSYTTKVSDVIADICNKAGMETNEYDVSSIPSSRRVRGYTIGSPSTGRKSLENLLHSYFVDAVETDLKVKFSPQTTTSDVTISEEWLGSVGKKDAKSNWVEKRLPDHQIPAKINLSFIDVDRDYQAGTTSKQRSTYPVDTMRSEKITTISLPLVLTADEALDITERTLYYGWSSRVSGDALLPWTYLAVNPSDIITYDFDSGRSISDKVSKSNIGANFNLEVRSNRITDGVFTAADFSSVSTSSVPSVQITTVHYSRIFVLNLPLLYDFHDTGRASSRYYVAVGSDTTLWNSAVIYKSDDEASYSAIDTTVVDVTWGTVLAALPAPRSIGTTDIVNALTIQLAVDNGDVNTITYDGRINSLENRAAVVNEATGEGEIIQFQDVVTNLDGSITMTNMTRGMNGTDYYSHRHVEGEVFIMLPDNAVLPEISSLSELGTTQYFKAASSGQSVGASPPKSNKMVANDLKPFAPTGVKRVNSGGDVTISWRRRTRFGGHWNMVGTGIEELPINEDYEGYEMYLLTGGLASFDVFDPLDPTSYSLLYTTTTPTQTITAAELSTYGLTQADTINVVLYQRSSQVSRGFKREAPLAP